MRESYTKQRTDACGLIVPDVTWGADESPEDRRAERRFLVAALVEHRLFGAASPELVIRRAGLGRVDGYAALADLERRGLVERDPFEGLLVTFSGRMRAGL